MRRFIWLLSVLALAMGAFTPITAFAGEWKSGSAPNEGAWWYENDDGSYAANGWYWLDGNRDNIAECYYFNADGWMLSETVTLDGYTVNEAGSWTENGIVKTRVVQETADFRTSYRYTRLGSVYNPEGLSEALGRGNVQVTFQIQP